MTTPSIMRIALVLALSVVVLVSLTVVRNPTTTTTTIPVTNPTSTSSLGTTITQGYSSTSTISQGSQNVTVATAGQRVVNFQIQVINPANVSGILYYYYPIVSNNGVQRTLHIGDTVGYSCDATLTTLTAINGNTATFVRNPNQTRGPCPICLSGDAMIDTPSGYVNVKLVRPGMQVWTADSHGNRLAGIVSQVGKAPVPTTHVMIRLVLADGRSILASPGHPTADGRRLGDLSAGSVLDGSVVIAAEPVQYDQNYTYDILPQGGTGTYWADGILVGSTLR